VAQYLAGVEVDAFLFGQSGGNGNEAFGGKDFALVGVWHYLPTNYVDSPIRRNHREVLHKKRNAGGSVTRLRGQ
jgi:hypothetical protein